MGISIVPSPLPAGTYFFSGSDAVAEGAIAAGCRYYGGYPITPSSEIMERIARRFDDVGGVFMQMEDELASICSVIGASWAGAKAMTATAGPGLSLMMEGIGYAAFTEAPIVVVDIQRAGPCTGQATHVGSGDIMQVKWGSHGDYQVIAYSPWSVQEMYDLTIKAFNMAERYRVPVFLMGSEAMAHLREQVVISGKVEVFHREKKPGAPPFDTGEPDGVPPMPAFGEGENLLVTGSTHDGYGFRKSDDPGVHERLVSRLHRKIMDHRREIQEVEMFHCDEDNLDGAVVGYGFTARSALFAVNHLRAEGKRVGMVRLKTLWPFPDDVIHEISERAGWLFVPEMNRGQVVHQVREYAACEVFSLNQTDGRTIHPGIIEENMRRLS
ncbi:MAG: 2-oxoacid:acceptor oxidoreductase subunit alpha [Deltaproteobacteria bacterium]|nr:2-oxoacid:acceptor oxidoreductase subunit alpha [Deltaproteobacteria bacterium]MBW2016031.1 2-oxoacid:acceptor oxidoreductase subunit alpha [Deltaproteobacteria bacterium]MBW2128328.1 2-oxoacid:acceptor oxidoreductase subunit alpha [Deltaproteobacteria bacterium]MBW2302158.1 2-oxoacid:acceptor oxidoreductase subunit alpha [Deltaproteobacteria bacterium]